MTAQFSEWHVMERIEVARLSVIAFVFFREDAAPVTLIAPAPAGVVRMTEDGRISGTAALCGLCPYGDKQDAQLDAITNSLSLAGQAGSRAYCTRRYQCTFKPCIFRGDFP
jgi:hypothetical protein